LPFYETGTIEKKPMSEADVIITMDMLREVKPHQVFCAGDFADPHGTHIVCFNIVLESLRRCKAAGDNGSRIAGFGCTRAHGSNGIFLK
jgi:glucosamine-6-phosphate deaminase